MHIKLIIHARRITLCGTVLVLRALLFLRQQYAKRQQQPLYYSSADYLFILAHVYKYPLKNNVIKYHDMIQESFCYNEC